MEILIYTINSLNLRNIYEHREWIIIIEKNSSSQINSINTIAMQRYGWDTIFLQISDIDFNPNQIEFWLFRRMISLHSLQSRAQSINATCTKLGK